MRKFRTEMTVIIMILSATAGFFIGAFINEAMNGAILFFIDCRGILHSL